MAAVPAGRSRAGQLSDEMREAAHSVLLPELWRSGHGSDALAATEKLQSVYFRSRAYASLLTYGHRDPDALSRLLATVNSLEAVEERVLCRAALARFVPVAQRCTHISLVLKDLEQQSDLA